MLTDKIPNWLRGFLTTNNDNELQLEENLDANRNSINNVSSVQSNFGNGLVGFWRFQAATGTTLFDYSGEENHGTIDGATWTGGRVGPALNFDGTDDEVSISHNESISFNDTESRTITHWMKTDVYSDGARTMEEGHNFYQFFYDNDFDTKIYDGSNLGQVSCNEATLTDGKWHLVTIVIDRDTDEMKLYIGTTEKDTDDISGVGDTSGTNDLYIGSGNSDDFLDGIIDEVRIYSRALSAQEITNIYEKTRGFYGV